MCLFLKIFKNSVEIPFEIKEDDIQRVKPEQVSSRPIQCHDSEILVFKPAPLLQVKGAIGCTPQRNCTQRETLLKRHLTTTYCIISLS